MASQSIAAWAAATTGTGSAVVKTKLRARCDRRSIERRRRGDVRAEAAERLAERADAQVDRGVVVEDPGGVRLVDREEGIVLAGEGGEVRDRRAVAVHAEDQVADDQPAPAVHSTEERAERVEVGVRVDDHARARQPAAVDDAGVVEGVREDDVVGTRRAPRSRRRWLGTRS